MSVQPYNITLGEESPTFQYTPVRDGPVSEGWNSSYSGNTEWNNLEDTVGVGTPYRRTEVDGAGFSLVFHGTALYLCLTTNSTNGIDDGIGDTVTVALTIDNNAVGKTASASDQACSSFPGSEILLFAEGLTYGSHTAEFIATMSDIHTSVNFYGGIVTLSAGPPGTIVSSSPLVVDDRNPEWVYEGSWGQGPATGEITRTLSYACAYDSSVTASLTFNGSAIVQLIGTLSANVFGYSVEFDNVETTYNGTNYWYATDQTMFFAGGLDPTQSYTLTLIDFDANQPNGPPGVNDSGCVNMEAVLLVQATLPNTQSTSSISGTATSPSSGASHSTGAETGGTGQSGGGLSGGAIAGIVIGALAVLALILAPWLLLSRMRKRASAQRSGQAVFTHSSRGSTPHPPDPIPYITPVQSSFTTDAPVSSVSGGAALSAGYRTEKSPRSIPNNAAYGGVRSSPGPLAEGEMSSSSDPRLANEILQNAPTVDLVTILNQRLRREQADNIEEPPTYASG
ncbi:hypothetical protein CALVIDRAFT_533139 [Calocera viscosa TUFC12733]|uniref:Uncharacterized protein n=1 Tax=Calocera viscosa (strain TUFC12733) TaxID=1330018 RepID=A0A167RDV6_CALVF|nr:hypothetical protein CALVIDRAFT_533139 [Calocera viscosa TUFC12733]